MTENSSNNNSNSDSYDFTIILSIILFSCIIYLFQQLLNSVNILSIEKNNELFENVINSIYFSVTTFSTVGFGDISTNTSFMSKITIWSMLFILIAYEIFNYDIYDDTEYKNSNKFKHFFFVLFIQFIWTCVHYSAFIGGGKKTGDECLTKNNLKEEYFKCYENPYKPNKCNKDILNAYNYDICEVKKIRPEYQLQENSIKFIEFFEYALVIRSTVGFGNTYPSYISGKITTIINILFNLFAEKTLLNIFLHKKSNADSDKDKVDS